jgi:hypothetical protein
MKIELDVFGGELDVLLFASLLATVIIHRTPV